MFGDIDPSWHDVTLEDLALHRSGAVDNLPASRPDLWEGLWVRDGADDRSTRAWFAEELLGQPAERPGGDFAYSNAGYILLGAALERTADRSWEDLMTTHLFEPLEMASCGFGPPRGRSPWGHTPGALGGWVAMDPRQSGSDNPSAFGPAGTVHCSLVDWGAFVALHLRGANGSSIVLDSAAFERMHLAVGIGTEAYGHGWVVETNSPAWVDGTLLFHGGSNTMWFAYMFLSPSQGRAWLAVTNAGLEAAAWDAIVTLATR
ncbi:MAG: serine hydrolase domain-containing protein [Myxococcota bacterium]